jgi:hypothetical protein
VTKAEREALNDLMNIGLRLSNVAYHLKSSEKLDDGTRHTLGFLQVRWDEYSKSMRDILNQPKPKRRSRATR